MKVFINEESLIGQYHTLDDFQVAVIKIVEIIKYLESLKVFTFYKKFDISDKKALNGESFLSALNKLPKELRTFYIRIVFDKTNPINWDTCSVQNDNYSLKGRDITGTSIAEFAERKIIDNDHRFLLNYSNQLVFIREQEVCKNSVALCRVLFKDNLDDLKDFIKVDEECQKYIYTNYENKPTDKQTFLRDNNHFLPTKAKFQNRRVYKCINDYYWYVDNKHTGEGAHIEVFGKNLKHLGTSLIFQKNINSSYKKERDIEDLKDNLSLL